MPSTPVLTGNSNLTAQTVRFQIKQERRRLEAITLRIRLKLQTGAPTGAAWAGLAGIVKEIRVIINDGPAGGGQRNVVQVSGMGLLGYVRQMGANLDRATQIAYASGGFPTTANQVVEISYYIPLRHLGISEPLANITSLPLSSKFLANDVFVEVDTYNLTVGAAGATPVFTGVNQPCLDDTAAVYPMLLNTHLREVDESFPYIRAELRTDPGFSSGSLSNVPYEFVSGGFMTGFLVQGLSADIANNTTRSRLLSSNGFYRVEYGREVLYRVDEAFMQSLNDLSVPEVYPEDVAAVGTSATLQNRMFTGESFFDFLSDYPQGDAFALSSVPDLNTDALGGDKFRLVFNDLAATTRRAHITYHKLLSSRDAILAVVKQFAKAGATA